MPSRKAERTELSANFNGIAGLARHFPALGILANLMKPGWAPPWTDVSQDALHQPLKGLPDGSIGQRLAARRDKEVFGSNVLIANPGVVLEGLKCTRVQGNQS